MLFWIYRRFTKAEDTTSLAIAPIIIWWVVNFIIPEDFRGAGFLIIPVLIAELILAISIFTDPRKTSRIILFALLSVPSVYMVAPMVKSFPVGLGLKILFVSAILIALLFGLLLPIVNATKSRRAFTRLFGFLTFLFFGVATFYSGFDADNRKPNSLVYVQNANDSLAFLGTYNQELDAFVQQKLGTTPIKGGISSANTKSKYNTRFSFHQKAEFVSVPTADINIEKDTLIEGKRVIDMVLNPNRNIRKFEFAALDSIHFYKLVANTIPVNGGEEYKVKRGSFLIYHFGNQDTELRLQMTLDSLVQPEIIVNEISDDLLTNPLFSINPRSEDMMPMPFVTNDAIISTQKIKLNYYSGVHLN